MWSVLLKKVIKRCLVRYITGYSRAFFATYSTLATISAFRLAPLSNSYIPDIFRARRSMERAGAAMNTKASRPTANQRRVAADPKLFVEAADPPAEAGQIDCRFRCVDFDVCWWKSISRLSPWYRMARMRTMSSK
jgi:hypothetical protein